MNVLRYGQFTVVPVWLDWEVNYTVFHGKDYLFRLVPMLEHFAISPLDRALQPEAEGPVADEISSWLMDVHA